MWKGRCADGHASDELNHCTLQLGVPPLPCCPFSICNVHSSMYIGLETSNVHAPAVPPLLKVCFHMGPWTLQTWISELVKLSPYLSVLQFWVFLDPEKNQFVSTYIHYGNLYPCHYEYFKVENWGNFSHKLTPIPPIPEARVSILDAIGVHIYRNRNNLEVAGPNQF